MAIIKDVTVRINNGTATLDEPVLFYEKDHDVELRFKLMNYKYKYDKDPQNILNSVDEDILEAYTTIVNPNGYELEQLNGVVKNDIVIFRLDPTYTDELDELGTYKLQIHIKCTCSEFTIPTITFEVLARLKGIKVVTDGEDEVDNSEILDNSSKFVSDETGKLIIEWKKGDMISSAKLNAMVDVINDAVDEEAIRQANEIERQIKAANKIQELENTRVEYINKIDTELDSFTDQVDVTMSNYETRFNALTVSQQQDAEVIDARDGEQSLRARLDRDIQKPSIIYEEVEGSYINADTTCGYVRDIETLGNTIQNQDNLADIRSVGDKVEGQELYKIDVVSSGKNLCREVEHFGINISDGQANTGVGNRTNYMRVEQGLEYTFSKNNVIRTCVKYYYDKNKEFISADNVITDATFTIPQNVYYLRLSWGVDVEEGNYQLEEGTQATPYEPYQEDKLTILSPTQLAKVGDVADRIICKDGVWGVEKNVLSYIVEDYSKFEVNDALESVYRIYIDTNNYFGAMNRGMISSIVPYKDGIFWNIDEEGVYSDDDEKYYYRLFIHINKSKIATTPEDYIREHLPIKVTYKNLKPTFIPLPHGQQVKLRTFVGQTNIHVETEIEGTLKAQVPKSIGATVDTHAEQIDNLNKELDRVKKLEESTTSTVVTESDFINVPETANGYFEDVKLEGNTLVNRFDMNTITIDQNAAGTIIKENNGYTITNVNESELYIKIGELNIEPNKTHTLSLNIEPISEDGRSNIYIYVDGEPIQLSGGTVVGVKNFVFTSGENSTYLRLDVNGQDSTIKFKDIIILEGDHTQNPPSYFEGLMSVGQDVDEVSIESVKGDGNLIDISKHYEKPLKFESSNKFELVTYIRINQDTDYTFTANYSKSNNEDYNGGIGIYLLNSKPKEISKFNLSDISDKITIHQQELKQQDINVSFNSVNYKYFAIYVGTATNSAYDHTAVIDNTKLVKSSISTDFEECQSDKKPLLYYNPSTETWEKPILRQWDSIEKHSGGKYYYHKRSGEIVLNGSETISLNTNLTKENTMYFEVKNISNNELLLCDRFMELSSGSYDEEGILGNKQYSNISIRILKSKLATQDVAGFEQWLQANPTTVVYQLAQEEVYECINIDLITYENETNFVVNAGTITPKSTLKVICNITNVVRELQQKVSNLENYIQHVMIDALNNALNE